MVRIQVRAAAVALTLGVILVACTARIAFAQLSATDCPAGSTKIVTAEDRAAARIAGIPDSSNCWQKQDANVGTNAAQAKQYLRSIVCKGSAFGGTTADGTVEGLDTKFAECAATFLKAMSSQLPGQVALLNGGTNAVCLREGYRTVEQQQKYAQEYLSGGGGIACTKGAGCEHPRGIAIDVNTATDQGYQTMWNVGPNYGVNFYLKSRDKVHFVPLKSGCAGGTVTPQSGVTTGTSFPTGGTNANPNSILPASYYDYPQYAQQAGAASSLTPFLSPLTTLAQQATQNTQPATTQTTLPSQTLPNYQNLFPNDQLYASSSYGSYTGSYTGSYSPYTSGSSTPTSSGGNTVDQLTNIAGGTNTNTTGTSASGSQTGTSAPTQLNGDLSDIVTDSGTGGTNTNISNDLAINDQPSNSIAVAPVHVPNTFPDGTAAPVQSTSVPPQQNGASDTILHTMLLALRDLLVSYLKFLQSHPAIGFKAPWQPAQPVTQIAD